MGTGPALFGDVLWVESACHSTWRNGRNLTPSQFCRISGFVTQDDAFNATLSIKETLVFAVRLRLSQGMRKSRVVEIIRRLQLDERSTTRVGDEEHPSRKGGVRRREATSGHCMRDAGSQDFLLRLEEPTSGLDAASASNVVGLLRGLADAGITDVASLHQPRNSIMAHFHLLMVTYQEHFPWASVELWCVPF